VNETRTVALPAGLDELLAALGTDPVAGLSSQEAAVRLERDGANLISTAKPTSAWALLGNQFRDFMIYVLVGAVVVSAIEGQVPEALAILAILLLNAVLGFFQEYRAERSLEALRQLSAPVANVIRDGVEIEIPATELVIGDIVVLEAGDTVPADGRLIETGELRVVESTLTGESSPVRKDEHDTADAGAALGDRRSMVFAGTSVAVGRARYAISGTGLSTEMGRIAELLASTEDTASPLQLELAAVGKRIAWVVLVIAMVIFVEEAFLELRGAGEGLLAALEHPEFRAGLTEGLLLAVALAVAAIPEGLPAIVTVALSLGVRRMAEHHAIVRRLHAVETLGSTTFICSDKTGTLTVNRMTVRRMLVGEDHASLTPGWGIEPESAEPNREDLSLLLRIAASCNDAHYGMDGVLKGDPTETALLEAARNLTPGHLSPRRIAEIPFDSRRKRMTTVHEIDGSRTAFVKGGADVILDLCAFARVNGITTPMTDHLRSRLSAANADLASTGYRTLAFAFRKLAPNEPVSVESTETDLVYVGVLGLVDPPRDEAHESISQCHAAGIRVAMITGDHALTARAIARQVGLLDHDIVLTGSELDAMSDDELMDAVEEVRVFARVDPEHKIRIVAALKERGHVVAMTGDGVNDAPALKKADIGVAMGLVGTDVARESADMVLTDDDFATIVRAVREGRIVFENLRKVILFLLSCNMSEVLIVFITALISPIPALLPLQILWINLITDGPPALALGADKGSSRVMERPPRTSGEAIITASRQSEILVQGTLMTAAGLTVFLSADRLFPTLGPAHVNTMLFTTMVLVQKAHAFNFLSESRSIFSTETFRNRWLNLAFLVTLALQFTVIYWPPAERVFRTVPLSLVDWTIIVAAILIPVLVIDVAKRAFTRSRRSRAGEAVTI
jgi:Ca2+-transporting ATPase